MIKYVHGKKSKDKAERVLSIYTRLKQGKVIYKEKESRVFSVTPRTIQRDITDIQCFLHNQNTENGELQEVVFDKALNEVKINEYAEYIDVLSIGILLDYDINDLKELSFDDSMEDGLVLALWNEVNVEKDSLMFPEYYGIFLEYLKGITKREDFLKYIVEKWYESSSEFYWYESDKSSEDIYVGYWC